MRLEKWPNRRDQIAARIHETAVVDHGVRIGEDVEIGPYCIIGPGVEIGSRSRLINSVTVMGHTKIGCDNTIFPYCVLGAPPQDLKYLGGDTRLEIGDDNVIREHVTMNVGTESGGGVTRVGSGNLVMCAAHIAHDCSVGDKCIISNQVLLAGHIHINDRVVLSGAVAIHHFVTVGEYAFVGGLSRIVQDVPPFLMTEGNPARSRAVNVVGLRRAGLDDEAIKALQAAFRTVFRGGVSVGEALDTLEADSPGKEVRRLVEFMRNRMAGKKGRAMQP